MSLNITQHHRIREVESLSFNGHEAQLNITTTEPKKDLPPPQWSYTENRGASTVKGKLLPQNRFEVFLSSCEV